MKTRTIGLWLGFATLAAATWFLWPATERPSAPSLRPAPPITEPETPPEEPETPPPAEVGDCALRGHVRDASGAPAAGHVVVVRQAGKAERKAVSDAGGFYAVEGIAAGVATTARLGTDTPEAVAIRVLGLTVGGTRLLDLHLAGEPVRVRVVDGAGTPIAGCSLSAHRVPVPGWTVWDHELDELSEPLPPAVEATCDAEGLATLAGLWAGRWRVVARKDGYADGLAGIDPSERPPEDEPYELELWPAGVVTGRVVDDDEQPLAGVLVAAGSWRSAFELGWLCHSPRTLSKADGTYELTGVPHGWIYLCARLPGGTPLDDARIEVGPHTRYDFVVPLGPDVTGTVTDAATGEPVTGAEVILRSGISWDEQAHLARTRTDAKGWFAFERRPRLPPRRLIVEKPGYARLDQASEDELSAGRGAIVWNAQLQPPCTLTGVVSGPDGPVAGAFVSAFEEKSGADGSCVSGADGSYRIEGLSAGANKVQVLAEGFVCPPAEGALPENTNDATGSIAVELTAGDPVRLDIRLERGRTITGTVRDAAGDPIRDADVHATFWDSSAETRTDAEGAFELPGVPKLGAPTIQVFAEGFREKYLSDVVKDVVEVTLQRAGPVRIHGTVSAGGAPIPAACRVEVQEWTPRDLRLGRSRFGGERVAPDGSYEVSAERPEAEFWVRVHCPGFVPARRGPLRLDQDATELRVDVELEPGHAVRGRVVSGNDGRPLAGAAISLVRAEEPGGHVDWINGPPTAEVHAVAAEDGTFEIAHAPAGRFRVRAAAAGHLADGVQVAIPVEGPVEVRLARSLSIGGRVRMDDGSVPSSVNVQVEGGGDDGHGGEVDTGSDGTFVFRDLPPGAYRVMVEPVFASTDNVRRMEFDAVDAGTADLELVLQPGEIISGVVIGDGAPVRRVLVKADGPEYWGYEAYTREDGAFEILGLDPGKYKLEIEAEGFEPFERRGVVAGTRELHIDLSSGLRISGVLVDAEGRPIPNRRLRGEPADDDMRGASDTARASTSADGSFVISGLVEGHYDVWPNEWWGDERVLLGADGIAAGTTDVLITAVEPARIEGKLVDEEGRPVAGANVGYDPAVYRTVHMDLTEPDGSFVLQRLIPEHEYAIEVEVDGYVPLVHKGVRAGSTGVVVTLVRGAVISGQVLGKDGAPLAGVEVYLRPLDEAGEADWEADSTEVRTDAEGRFRADTLKPGIYYVRTFFKTGDGEWEHVKLGNVRTGTTGVILRAE